MCPPVGTCLACKAAPSSEGDTYCARCRAELDARRAQADEEAYRAVVPGQRWPAVFSGYGITISQARYQGTYEGCAWFALPFDPPACARLIDEYAQGSDVECMRFWGMVDDLDLPVGRGDTPTDAYEDLLRKFPVQVREPPNEHDPWRARTEADRDRWLARDHSRPWEARYRP